MKNMFFRIFAMHLKSGNGGTLDRMGSVGSMDGLGGEQKKICSPPSVGSTFSGFATPLACFALGPFWESQLGIPLLASEVHFILFL